MPARDDRFNLYKYLIGDERLAAIANSTAIEFEGQAITYRRLRGLTDWWADRIAAEGIVAGDRVALLLLDSPEFISCFLATTSLGALCVPISTFHSTEDLAFVLSDSGAKLAIVEDEIAKKHPTALDAESIKVIRLTLPRESYERTATEPVHESYVRQSPRAVTTKDSPCFIL